MFSFETKVRLHDTDAAGLLFFGNQFKMAHDAYEAFLESIDYPISTVLLSAPILLPIVHAEADYTRPLAVGDRLTIVIRVEKVSTHSFVLVYQLINEEGESVGTVQTVHVAIDKSSRRKTPLPPELKERLEKSV